MYNQQKGPPLTITVRRSPTAAGPNVCAWKIKYEVIRFFVSFAYIYIYILLRKRGAVSLEKRKVQVSYDA